jgi:hypothetical protein
LGFLFRTVISSLFLREVGKGTRTDRDIEAAVNPGRVVCSQQRFLFQKMSLHEHREDSWSDSWLRVIESSKVIKLRMPVAADLSLTRVGA